MADETEIAHAGVVGRGVRARTELTETRAAFDGLRAAMLDEIVRTAPEHTRKLDRLIAGVQVIDGVKKALETAVREGESVQTYRELLDDAYGPAEAPWGVNEALRRTQAA